MKSLHSYNKSLKIDDIIHLNKLVTKLIKNKIEPLSYKY
jgi:hypothetical protein